MPVHDTGIDHVNHHASNLNTPSDVRFANPVGSSPPIGLFGIENVLNVLFIVNNVVGILVRLLYPRKISTSFVLLIHVDIVPVRLQDSHLNRTSLVNSHKSGRGQTQGLLIRSM
jgi:hypothetical protein